MIWFVIIDSMLWRCVSWIRDDALDVINNDIAPSDFSILHVHWPRAAERAKFRWVVVLHSLSARIINNKKQVLTYICHSMQLIGLQVNQILVKVADIYRPPSSSKRKFLDKFADLFSMIRQVGKERLIICRYFNLPGGRICQFCLTACKLVGHPWLSTACYGTHAKQKSTWPADHICHVNPAGNLQCCCAHPSLTIRS